MYITTDDQNRSREKDQRPNNRVVTIRHNNRAILIMSRHLCGALQVTGTLIFQRWSEWVRARPTENEPQIGGYHKELLIIVDEKGWFVYK